MPKKVVAGSHQIQGTMSGTYIPLSHEPAIIFSHSRQEPPAELEECHRTVNLIWDLVIFQDEIKNSLASQIVDQWHVKQIVAMKMMMDGWVMYSPFKNIPTPADIATFNPRMGPCCTVDCFSVDLEGTSHSPWNKLATDIFATNFRETYLEINVTHKVVVQAWSKHFEMLKGQYITLGELYGHHLNAPQTLPGDIQEEFKNQLIKMVQWLGPNGMSSNESDHEGLEGKPLYCILQKLWCSLEVTELLRLLDVLHLYKMFGKAWNVLSGAWPHMHSSRMQVSTSSPVESLPQNFYSQKWLKENRGFLHTAVVPLLPMPQQIQDIAAPYDLNKHSIEMTRRKEKKDAKGAVSLSQTMKKE
ncbi:hypothetical protein BD769DRAFT_1385540 [Suillus cothurnatus]|nr:hypothetical protein BD769DRAFT_1385540 [Suillus cothurnatus]